MAHFSKAQVIEDLNAPASQSWLTPTAVAHAAFVPTGIVTVLLGPVLPSLSARWSLNDAQAGELFTAQFLASMLGVALSGMLVPRFGYRVVIVLGLLFMVVGVAGLPLGSRFVGMAAVAGYGVGLGLTIPACNLLVAEVNPANRAAAVSLLNFSWSVGAVACPFLLAPFQRRDNLSTFFYALAAAVLLISAVLARVAFPPPVKTAQPSEGALESLWAMLQSPVAIALGVLFFVYVGTENAMGGWLATYAKRLSENPGTLWVTAPSFFYTGLLTGRALAPVFLRWVTEVRLARASMGFALLGMVGLLASRSMTGVIVSATVIGLGLAAMYPITISLLSSSFGTGATRLGSVMFMLASCGAACMPWLVGFTSTRMSSLKMGLAIPLAGSVLILILYFRKWGSPETT
jgi:FHS family glucose/mannose:H+ symporter-like MFS transporter